MLSNSRHGICWQRFCSAILRLSTDFPVWFAISYLRSRLIQILETGRRFTGDHQTRWTRRNCHMVWTTLRTHAKAQPLKGTRLNFETQSNPFASINMTYIYHIFYVRKTNDHYSNEPETVLSMYYL